VISLVLNLISLRCLVAQPKTRIGTRTPLSSNTNSPVTDLAKLLPARLLPLRLPLWFFPRPSQFLPNVMTQEDILITQIHSTIGNCRMGPTLSQSGSQAEFSFQPILLGIGFH